jgi:hypothetical protein
VHPITGSEAFVTSNGSTIRVRVPLAEDGEQVVAAVLAAFDETHRKDGPRQREPFAVGSVRAKKSIEAEPAFKVLTEAGFQADQR